MKLIYISTIKSLLLLGIMLTSIISVYANGDIPEFVEFSYATNDPLSASGSSTDCYRGGAILLTEEITQRYDQCIIEEIIIANGDFPNQDSAPIEIFCTYQLDEKPFFSFESEMDIEHPREYKAHVLSEPLTIRSGEPFFIGFVAWAAGLDNSNSKFTHPVYADYNLHTNLPGGYFGISYTSGEPNEMDWSDDGYACGQVCMKLKISGENLPQNVGELNEVSMRDYYEPDSRADVYVEIFNRGVNVISDVDISCTINNQRQTYHLTFEQPVEYNQYTFSIIQVIIAEEGVNIPVLFSIDKVNGKEASPTAKREQTRIIHSFEADKGFRHNMVVEEAGGSGCGWCVRGIVGLDRMYKAHDDGSFIPISAHSPGYGYETSPTGYEPFWERYITHNPSCLINRNIARFGISDPESDVLDILYTHVISSPAIAAIEVTDYEFDGDWLKVSSEIEFALPEDNSDYRVAYVVTEDNVGPYSQYNSYSGMDIDMDGWENLPSPTTTYYDFLARGISNFDGTSLEISSSITPGVKYIHTDKVPLDKVRDFEQLHVIAMLINGKTDCIENGTRLKILEENSIPGICADDSQAQIEYFDLSGRKIDGIPSTGIYIRKQGIRSTKVAICGSK